MEEYVKVVFQSSEEEADDDDDGYYQYSNPCPDCLSSSGDECEPTLNILEVAPPRRRGQRQRQARQDRQLRATAERLLSNTQVADRMRTLFEKSLQLHLNGDYLKACDAVCTPLYPHQMFALAWMSNRENLKNLGMKGGILADDMGLGKTLSILALILTNFHDGKPMAKPEAFFKRQIPRSALRYMPDVERLQPTSSRSNRAASSSKSLQLHMVGNRPIKPQKLLIDSSDDYTSDEEKSSDSVPFQSSSELQEYAKSWSSKRKRQRLQPLKSDSDDEAETEVPSSNNKGHMLNPRLSVDGASDSDLSKQGRQKVHQKMLRPKAEPIRLDPPALTQTDFELPDVEFSDNEDEKQNRPTAFFQSTDLTPLQRMKLRAPPKDIALLHGRRKATLIVTPASLIGQWLSQIELHIFKNVDIDVFVHHGTSKAVMALELEDKHIVLTTYGTLMAEFKDEVHGPLLRVKWLRVVLDEGHLIKNHRSKTFKAAKILNAERKWIVSGTPIQNNLTELWALLNWIEEPNYSDNRAMFKYQIENPIKDGHPRGVERLQVLMEAICLRRTKTDQVDGKPLVSLPTKTVTLRELDFSEEERIIYDAYHNKGKELIEKYLRCGSLLRNYAHVFAVMMRLRQLCCHRELLPIKWLEVDLNELTALAAREIQQNEGNTEAANSDEVTRKLADQLRQMITDGMSDECSICLSEFVQPVITPCAHVFCRDCVTQHIDSVPPPAMCPLCRGLIKVNLLLEAATDEEREARSEKFDDIVVQVSSTKVMAAMRELELCRRKNVDEKVIICSQFTSLLSIFQPLLTEAGFEWTRLDGTMSIQDRLTVISSFQSDKKSSPKVLLLSLRAGGVGLNLTAANKLILLDPAWNPSTEEQCFDRIHRLGQTKDVEIIKFVMKDSIEQRMLDIQDKKRNLISGAFRQTEYERRQQRIQDIRDIFGI